MSKLINFMREKIGIRIKYRHRLFHGGIATTCAILAVAIGILQAVKAQTVQASADELEPLVSLKTVPVPGLSAEELKDLIKNETAAIQLGKALFWDTRVGSDNKTSCATCHFHAGADSRITNQLGPGLLAGDKAFQLGGPNYRLKPGDFPLTRHTDLNDAATMWRDINDVVSSQGVFTSTFNGIASAGAADKCAPVSDAVGHGGTGFNLNGVNTRRVEPRNAPTVINSVFNFRNFWDGRANNVFNGAEPFGLRNPDATIWKVENGVLRRSKLALQFAPLASLASGPPLSENEMSCRGRAFVHLGKKLIGIRPLADQAVAPTDSVLGGLSLRTITYGELVRRAFQPAYWNSTAVIDLQATNSDASRTIDLAPGRRSATGRPIPPRDRASAMEANFALFFSVALQLYQSTLVSDDTPFDRFAAGDTTALSQQQINGLAIFRGQANCIHCHVGAELTSASFSNLNADVRLDERAGDAGTIFKYDNGFFNTGVRPTADDPGVGGVDPFGLPFSETRMAQTGNTAKLGSGFHEGPLDSSSLTAVDGAFKTPGLRNVEFTGPYFHNGGKATLMQVVDFYNRGGDFTVQNRPIPDPAIVPLGLTQSQKNDLVAFLLALSDNRVRFQQAPFDHPSICVPNGHVGNEKAVTSNGSGQALDVMLCLPEVGAAGSRTALTTFLGLSPFDR